MLVALAARLRHRRRRALIAAVVVVLAVGLVEAHGAMADAHMGKAAMCLAIAVGAGGSLALLHRRSGPPRLSPGWSPGAGAPYRPPAWTRAAISGRARAGPRFLQVMRR